MEQNSVLCEADMILARDLVEDQWSDKSKDDGNILSEELSKQVVLKAKFVTDGCSRISWSPTFVVQGNCNGQSLLQDNKCSQARNSVKTQKIIKD